MERMKDLKTNKEKSMKNLRWAFIVLLAALIVSPALANPGLYTGCLDSNNGTYITSRMDQRQWSLVMGVTLL